MGCDDDVYHHAPGPLPLIPSIFSAVGGVLVQMAGDYSLVRQFGAVTCDALMNDREGQRTVWFST